MPVKMEISPNGRECRVCHNTFPWDNFYVNRTSPNGKDSRCKECKRRIDNEYDRTPEQRAKKVATAKVYKKTERGRATTARAYYKYEYGITVAEFEAMLARQQGKCAICDKKPATHVDHCHKTNTVRGLLCNKCNLALGMFDDDFETLIRAAGYLKQP